MSHPWKASLKENAPMLISVEMPCFVKSQDRALDMIGGSEHVQRTLSVDDGAPLECRLPGDNILRPNLVSSLQCKRSVVLKIKRKKVIKNGKVVSSTITSFDIVGLVKKTVVFTNPADFQFLPTFNSSSSYNPSSMSASAPPKGHTPLEIVPQSISRVDFQKRQQFLNFLHVSKRMKRNAGVSTKKEKAASTGNLEGGSDSDGNEKDDEAQRKEAGDDDDKSTATTNRRRNPDAGHTQILKFGDSIPGIHPLGKYPPRWVAKRDKTGEVFRGIQFIDRLNLLFEKIPVLKRSQIVDMLDLGPRQHLMKECLPYAAYTYSNGPFASLWIRYGYDATAHPSSRIYQNLNCRFPPQYLIKLSDSLADYIGRESVHRKMVDLNKLQIVDAPEKFEHRFINTGAFARMPMSLFGYICKHQIAFQVHTLADKRLFAFIQQLPITNMCTEQTGWFTEDALVVFRNFICEVMEQRVQLFLQSAVVFAPRPPPSIIARSEDQALVAVRVQKALDDFQVFEHVDEAWILAQDTYTPTISLASPVTLSTTAPSSSSPSFSSLPSAGENGSSTGTSPPSLSIELEETVARVMFFWLTKYRLAAAEKSEMVEKMLLPALSRRSFSTGGSSSSEGTNLISTAVSTNSGGSEWSSSKRKSGRQTELEDKVRDQSAIWSATYTMQQTTPAPPTSAAASTLGPLFSAASQPPMVPSTATTAPSASKRNVRFAPNVAASSLSSSSSSMAVAAPVAPAVEPPMANLQFTLNSDVLAKTTGFSMLGDDSDSEDD